MASETKIGEAIETLDDICKRADAMNLGLVKYPVEDVRAVLAELRRHRMRVPLSAPEKAGEVEK